MALRRQLPPPTSYGFLPIAAEPTRGRHRSPIPWRRLIRLGLLAAAVAAIPAWMLLHDDPRPGLSLMTLEALGLSALLDLLIFLHYRDGRLRWVVRVAAEWAAVAALAALVTLATVASPDRGQQPATPAPPAARPKPPTVAQATPACPDPSLAHAPSWLSCVWHRAMDPAPPPTTTRRNR